MSPSEVLRPRNSCGSSRARCLVSQVPPAQQGSLELSAGHSIRQLPRQVISVPGAACAAGWLLGECGSTQKAYGCWGCCDVLCL